jgi:hypothetical protein
MTRFEIVLRGAARKIGRTSSTSAVLHGRARALARGITHTTRYTELSPVRFKDSEGIRGIQPAGFLRLRSDV